MAYVPKGQARLRRILGLVAAAGLVTVVGCSGGTPKPAATATPGAVPQIAVTSPAPAEPLPAATTEPGAYPPPTQGAPSPYPAATP